jgi:hypothetical protein
MADAPKPKPKAGGKPPAKPAEGAAPSPILEYVFWVVLIFFLLSLLPGLLGTSGNIGVLTALADFFSAFVPTLGFIALFVTLLFGMALIYVFNLNSQLMTKARQSLRSAGEESAAAAVSTGNLTRVQSPLGQPNERWQNVVNHIESSNSSDWRLAIIEADIILEEMLEKMGYHGAGVGEMLKSVEKSDFSTLDLAWEAHKTRNNIAHQGGDFVISHEEALRVIDLYKQVFHEFYYI